MHRPSSQKNTCSDICTRNILPHRFRGFQDLSEPARHPQVKSLCFSSMLSNLIWEQILQVHLKTILFCMVPDSQFYFSPLLSSNQLYFLIPVFCFNLLSLMTILFFFSCESCNIIISPDLFLHFLYNLIGFLSFHY